MPLQPFKVKAVFDYASPHEDDLSFPNGQIITVTEEEDEEWYYGEYKDADGITRSGLFPRNHVEKFEPVTPPRPARHNKKLADPAEPVPSKPHVTTKPESPVETVQNEVSLPEAMEGSSATKQSTVDIPAPAPQPPAPEQATETAAEKPTSQPPPAAQTSPAAVQPPPAAAQSPPAAVQSPPAAVQSPPIAVQSPPAPMPNVDTPREEILANKKLPPPVAGKPSSGSFKDRIAAFNKPAAPPVAPMKPGSLSGPSSSGFVKKPFIPAPPSRNAYVAPPREKPQVAYHREEEPERQVDAPDAAAGRPMESTETDPSDDQPKPTSLKERIALLQKQQLEQAARHSEAAQKREKPARPSKKRTESPHIEDGSDAPEPGDIGPSDEAPRSIEAEADDPRKIDRPTRRRTDSKDEMPTAPGRELVSDTNDADQSAGPETEDGEPSQQAAELDRTKKTGDRNRRDDDEGDEDQKQEEEEEEEDDVDPEIRRRMELRERMAKMSGGMGMAGMFGPPGGLPSMPKKKSRQSTEEKARSGSTDSASAAPIPIMALPGMSMPGLPKVSSPIATEEADRGASEPFEEASKVSPAESDEGDRQQSESEEDTTTNAAERRDSGLKEDPTSKRLSTTRAPPPPPPQGRPAPPVPPIESRPAPPVPRPIAPSQLLHDALSDSEGEEDIIPGKDKINEDLSSRRPPPVPSGRPVESKAPPVPTTAPPVPAHQGRAPPPPPPAEPPRTVDNEVSSEGSGSEEESTEYEADIDTDIAPSASHKDALTAHDKKDSTDDTLTSDEASYHHSGLPSLGLPASRPPPPPPSAPPRGVPPPPPTQAPGQVQSSGMPRAAPPPPPVPKRSSTDDFNDDSGTAMAENSRAVRTTSHEVAGEGDLYSVSPPERRSSNKRTGLSSPPQLAAPPPPPPKMSMEGTREGLNIRPSMDANRISMEQGFIADDIDLGNSAQWWMQRRTPPPVLQTRSDVCFEFDETSFKQDGNEVILKHVHVLYMDYSKTVITARFTAANATDADLQQRHEPPPPRLRQDQLESAYARYGPSIADLAKSKTNTVVGNGSPSALVLEIFGSLDALPPVGNRAYGALVYVNLANATVQQHDEIRAGDIVSFRNAKLQGHRGAMKQKYSIEVGKPDHVGIVVDWDGTKKKVQAWEQGRESKKVKIDSFKLGDLRSGEVKVWRVMPRTWVGWGTR